MGLIVIRSKVKPENAADIEAATKKMFAAIKEVKPQDVRYMSARMADGQTYLTVVEFPDGIDNPLLGVPAVREFQENLKSWLAGPPTPEQYEIVSEYGFSG